MRIEGVGPGADLTLASDFSAKAATWMIVMLPWNHQPLSRRSTGWRLPCSAAGLAQLSDRAAEYRGKQRVAALP